MGFVPSHSHSSVEFSLWKARELEQAAQPFLCFSLSAALGQSPPGRVCVGLAQSRASAVLPAPDSSPPTEPSLALLFPLTPPCTFPSSLQGPLIPQVKAGG